MTSQLNVDTIADKAGSGPVGLHKQEAAKARCMFNMTGTAALLDSFNTSGYLDVDDGEGKVSFTNNFGNANYSVGSMTTRSAGTDSRKYCIINFEYEHDDTGTAPATDSLQFVAGRIGTSGDNPTRNDMARASLIFHGDLA